MRGLPFGGEALRLIETVRSQLAREEIGQLMGLCNDQRDAFLMKRSDPWSHRKKSSGYIFGAKR